MINSRHQGGFLVEAIMIRAILFVYVGVVAILACVLSDSAEIRGMAGAAVFGCGMICMYFVERHNRN